MAETKIGILGGIGPEATGLFYLKLIEEFQVRGMIKSNADFPHILINSIPAPELIDDNIDYKDLDMYIRGLKELDSLRPDFIVMVCNTIHLFYDLLNNKVESELIDLREEVFRAIKKTRIKKITVIGTPNTIIKGLYRFDRIEYFNPSRSELEELSKAIFDFNRGQEKEKQKEKVISIVNRQLSLGSEAVLLGCTEFGIMLGNQNIPKINTMDVLVDAVIRRCKKK